MIHDKDCEVNKCGEYVNCNNYACNGEHDCTCLVKEIVKDYGQTFTDLKKHDETPDVGDWEKELEEQDWYQTFTQTWQEDQCKGFVHRIISKREAEAYQAGIRSVECKCNCATRPHAVECFLLHCPHAELHGNK